MPIRPLPIAVAAGVAAGAVVLGLMEATVRFIPAASPWASTLSILLTSLSPIVPGFAAGFVAARSGFAVGAVASVLTSILGSIYVNFIAARSVMDPASGAVPDEVTFAVAALVIGGVCGIAGCAVGSSKMRPS